MRCTLLALCVLLLAPAAFAKPKVSLEEWQYLSRVGVVSSVNEALWKGFEDSGGWSPELARYARDATRLNVRILRSWSPPVAALFPFHNSLIEVLAQMEHFYDAIAARNFGQAEQIGVRIRQKMRDVELGWMEVQDRYATPASP